MDEILKILQKDGRQDAEAIAAQIGMSASEVNQKIKELEDKGIIIKYKAVINDTLIQNNNKISALIEVKVKPQKDKGFEGIAKEIYKYPEVISCVLLSGTYDLLLEVSGNNIQTISNFVSQNLSQVANVQSTVTHFILKKYKVEGDILDNTLKDDRLAVSP